ncbi:hypothetical protein AB0H36_05280 [Kribbella sp. NPDC050820]|uniref:hypothetical protein n=1 Tax=Kribbella sp. NPDC050820 TaxID=3155408 RepID=UPI0033CCD948
MSRVDDQLVRARVWFGRWPFIDYTGGLEAGTANARTISRRFFGLPVAIDPAAVDREGAER